MILKVETLQRHLAEIHKRAIGVYTKHKILPEYNQTCTLSIEKVGWVMVLFLREKDHT